MEMALRLDFQVEEVYVEPKPPTTKNAREYRTR